ncbi:hypothetical protein GGQ84_000688 [Desulfitispora alkaliphila]|uniref:DUF3786 domain-containing protein n=1 Tax=Desulfitispora alkaliphila TaxID=622674 RepID=UPI003D1D5F9E
MSEKNYLDALTKAQQEFATGDPLTMADCSGATYEQTETGKGYFKLRYLNRDYRVDYPSGEVSFFHHGSERQEVRPQEAEQQKTGCARPIPQIEEPDYSGDTILISDKTLMLMYLKQASGLPPREQLINFLQLPEGGHHHVPFIVDAINPMVEFYDQRRKLFYEAVAKLDGEINELGDFGATIQVFPKIPLAMMVWEGDEEFPAKGNVLFDETVSSYLDTAGAYVMGINAARRLVAVGQKLAQESQ